MKKALKSLSPKREGEAVEERRKMFWAELEQFIGKYNRQMVLQFYYYWAEEMKGVDQMRWEIQKSWNTSYRLAAWSKRSFNKNDEAAALRLERTKAKSTQKEPSFTFACWNLSRSKCEGSLKRTGNFLGYAP